jgi:hypothetical protein
MLLAQKRHTAGNTIRYLVDYSDWLEQGETLTAGTVVMGLPAVTDVTISEVTFTPEGHLIFFLAGGTLNEIFTLATQITDSRTEVKNDTIGFSVVAP